MNDVTIHPLPVFSLTTQLSNYEFLKSEHVEYFLTALG